MNLEADPDGPTPLDPDDLDGLIPVWIATRSDLNAVEYDNIIRALQWGRNVAVHYGVERVLSYEFAFSLHRRMFDDVWKWAGKQRRRQTNIGVEASGIAQHLKSALDDALFWHHHETYNPDEIAIRIHQRVVWIHPFPNGNGRHSRLLADLYLLSIGRPMFSWSGELSTNSDSRRVYLRALRDADNGKFFDLLRFARGQKT